MVCSVNAKNTDDLTIEESIIVKLFRSQYVGTFFGLLIHTATYFILRVRSAEISKPYPDNPKKSFFNPKKKSFSDLFSYDFPPSTCYDIDVNSRRNDYLYHKEKLSWNKFPARQKSFQVFFL